MMRRRAIEAALDTVSTEVNITEDQSITPGVMWRRYGRLSCGQPDRERRWHLSCGQLVDLVIDDSQLLQLAHHLEQGCSLELSLAHVLDPA
jgi:hypothetical protein